MSFLDVSTRAVSIDIAIYNPTFNTFLAVRYFLEVLSSGAVLPQVKMRFVSPRLMFRSEYFRGEFFTLSSTEVAVWVFFACYMAHTLWQLVHSRCRDCCAKAGWWAKLDLINYALWIAVMALRAGIVHSVPSELANAGSAGIDLLALKNSYVDLYSAAYMSDLCNRINSLNAVLMYFKVLKYLDISPNLSHILKTLQSAANDLLLMFVMMATLWVGFGLAFMTAFGNQVMEFRDIQAAFLSMVLTSIGIFPYDAVVAADPVLGNLLFILYVFLVILVAFNLFVGIISGHYERVQESLAEMKDKDPLLHAARSAARMVSSAVASKVNQAAAYVPPAVRQKAAASVERISGLMSPPAPLGGASAFEIPKGIMSSKGLAVAAETGGVVGGPSLSPQAGSKSLATSSAGSSRKLFITTPTTIAEESGLGPYSGRKMPAAAGGAQTWPRAQVAPTTVAPTSMTAAGGGRKVSAADVPIQVVEGISKLQAIFDRMEARMEAALAGSPQQGAEGAEAAPSSAVSDGGAGGDAPGAGAAVLAPLPEQSVVATPLQ